MPLARNSTPNDAVRPSIAAFVMAYAGESAVPCVVIELMFTSVPPMPSRCIANAKCRFTISVPNKFTL